MRNILTHANPEWREQRSICARILDPKNQDKMKRRRAGVVHTNWDNLMLKWADTQRWWEKSKDWESFVKTAEDLHKRSLRRNEDNKMQALSLNGGDKTQNKEEEERKKNKMKERERQRNWDPAWSNQSEVRDQQSKIQDTQNTMDKTDIRPMRDHLDMFHNMYREWNQDADRLTHVAREKRSSMELLHCRSRSPD